MTYSIVARDPKTGWLGIAVASRFFAVGGLVPYIRRNAAVATQAFVNPLWGVEGAVRLQNGEYAADVLNDFVTRDTGQAARQAHMIDSYGNSAAHTGKECVPWAGHVIRHGVSVAGNMLTGPEVVAETMRAYIEASELPFPERLLTAMEAGEAAGGDKRGKQSAALKIHRGEDFPLFDLRADDQADPLAELRRLLAVTQERYVHFAEALATSDNFSGTPDRTKLEAAIAAAEADRNARGIASFSYATSTLPSA